MIVSSSCALLVAGLAFASPAIAGPTCHGRFMNPITDICWSCVFPLSRSARSRSSPTGRMTSAIRLPGLLLQQPAAHRRCDRLLGTGAPGRCDPHAVLPGGSRRHRHRSGHRRPARRPGRPRQPDAQQLLPRALVRESDPLLARGAARLPVPGEGRTRSRLSDRGRSPVGRRRADRDPQPGSGALRQPARESGVRRRLCRRHRRLSDRESLLVRRLPGIDLSHERTCRHPHRRRAGLDTAHPAHDRQDAPPARDLRRRGHGGPLRLLPAADHGQDPLQDADGLSGAEHPQGRSASAASPSGARR